MSPSAATAIARQRDEWIAAVNARHLERYAAVFAEDGVWIPPGQPAVRGRAAFREWVRPFFERYAYDFSIAEAVVRVAGEWAVERGTFSSTLTEGTGRPVTHGGAYVLLWRRDADGQWRIDRYADVTDRIGHG